MDHSGRDIQVRYVKSAAGTTQQSSSTCVDSEARQSSLKCVNGDDVIIISDDADDVGGHLASWICTNCSTVNPVTVAQCISCLALQMPDSLLVEDAKNGEEIPSGAEGGREIEEMDVDNVWVCRRCTLQNEPKSVRCEVCEAPRRNVIFNNHTMNSVTGHRQQLADGKVDLLGTGSGGSCCGVDKSDSAAGESVMQNEYWAVWTCSNCTYNNNPTWANICDVCETVKQVYSSPQKPAGIRKALSSVKQAYSSLQQAGIGKAISSVVVGSSKQKVAKSWQCAVCSRTNANSVRDCAYCGALRTMADSKSAEDSWTCAKCTLQNNSLAHVCAVCLNKRNTVLPQVDDSDTKWPCWKCTFINNCRQNFCQACGFEKQSSFSYNSNYQMSDKYKPDASRQCSVSVKEQQDREEMAAREQWTDIVNFCKVNGEQFVDDSFPPTGKSLHYDGSCGKVVQWLRLNHVRVYNKQKENLSWWQRLPARLYSEEERSPWRVFCSPKPSDICQGVLGNCWFMSSLSVVAERPALLELIVITREYCAEGVYQVRLCKDGRWTTVVVDDLFPCDEFCRLLYSQAKRQQLWVPLIEKALAKVYGCYEALTNGRCIEGLSTLTGAPCYSIPMPESAKSEDSKNVVWAQLLSSRESGFLMGASCGSGNMVVDDGVYQQLGLVPRHAYSILDVQIVEGYRLLRLRNPWGRFSWRGDWSDTSPLWQRITQAHRSYLKPLGQQDGTFWISLDDVMRYFDSVDICKYRSDWMESRQKTTLPSSIAVNPQVTQVEVFEATEVDIGLFQEGARSQESSKRNSVDLCICIYQCRGSEAVGGAVGRLLCCSKREVRYFAGTNFFLEPGIYLVFAMAFNHWSLIDLASVDAMLTIHSCKAVLVSTLTLPTTCLADAITQLAVAKGERHEGREGMTTYYLTRNWAGFIAVVENRNPHHSLHVQCDCSESSNVVSTRGTLKTVDAIPPLHRQVIILLTHMERSVGYSVSHRLIHRLWSIGTGLADWAPGANHVPALTHEVYGLHAPRPL